MPRNNHRGRTRDDRIVQLLPPIDRVDNGQPDPDEWRQPEVSLRELESRSRTR